MTAPMTPPFIPPITAPAVRLIASTEIDDLLPTLVDLLCDTVNGGAPLGFLAPVTPAECRRYWLSLGPELRGGSRLLFAATVAGRLVGSGQLALPKYPNARHRAELQKLLVAPALRGHGIGRRLVLAIHDAALQRGRSLLLLNTRHGGPAERFYRSLGYREVGVVPGYAAGASGEVYDSVAMYRQLRSDREVGA